MSQQHERRATCPPWCELRHGSHSGEEDEVHIGGHACIRNVLMRLCATVDPTTGRQDGPYLLLDTHELTLDEMDALIATLTGLRDRARDVTRPAGA